MMMSSDDDAHKDSLLVWRLEGGHEGESGSFDWFTSTQWRRRGEKERTLLLLPLLLLLLLPPLLLPLFIGIGSSRSKKKVAACENDN